MVDQAGNAVAEEKVQSGVPVTVYYSKSGDKMVAAKVVVKETTAQPQVIGSGAARGCTICAVGRPFSRFDSKRRCARHLRHVACFRAVGRLEFPVEVFVCTYEPPLAVVSPRNNTREDHS